MQTRFCNLSNLGSLLIFFFLLTSTGFREGVKICCPWFLLTRSKPWSQCLVNVLSIGRMSHQNSFQRYIFKTNVHLIFFQRYILISQAIGCMKILLLLVDMTSSTFCYNRRWSLTVVQEGMGAWFLAKRGVDWESFVSWVQSKWKRMNCWISSVRVKF